MLDNTKAYAVDFKKLTPFIIVELCHVKRDRNVRFDLRDFVWLVVRRSMGGYGLKKRCRKIRDKRRGKRDEESGGWIECLAWRLGLAYNTM